MAAEDRPTFGPVLQVDRSRAGFRRILAGNPNFFGNLPESGFAPVQLIASNTTYEELTSVGYNQHIKRLFATFDVKRTAGYGGDLCDDGSTEYVRFYVDLGGGWQDAGLVATDVHDIPGGTDCAGDDRHPLSYSLELPFAPPRKWCTTPQLPRVRAILSWNLEPPAGTPNWWPVYGNIHECHIQIDKSRFFFDFFEELTSTVKIPKGLLESAAPFLTQAAPDLPDIPGLPEPPFPGPTALGAPAPLSLDQRISRYATRDDDESRRLAVEPSRLAFAEVQALKALPSVDVLGAQVLNSALKPFEVGLEDLLKVIEDTKGNVSYEELEELGLDGRREKLVATYRVKKQSGFSGGLCSAGSLEHVAFWADWNNSCEWEYLGTVSVAAYDFDHLPDGGLCYSAALPVDLDELKRRCIDPKVARVRAVLSWSSLPSTTNPNLLPTWGNRLDAHVLVPRREGLPGSLSVIGGVSTEFISDVTGMASATAKFADNGVQVFSPLGLDVPFGGLIVVRGPAVTGKRYRLQIIDSGGASQTLTEKIWVTPVIGVSSYHTGTADGWFDYLPHSQNFAAVLGYYRSDGNDKVTVQLEIEGDGVVDSQVVQLDNVYPDVAVSITHPVGDCGLIHPGVQLEGLVEAKDLHMGSWSVVIDGGPAGFGPVAVASGNANTAPGGTVWTFDTTGMVQCGYVVRVNASDRAIVNSGNSQHQRSDDVGFCVLT